MTTIKAGMEVRELLVRWLGVANAFCGSNGAIIAHNGDCLFYKLYSRGLKPSRRDCTCPALTIAEDMVRMIADTKGEIDRLDHHDAPIYASPCAACRCGSLCHWDDENTPSSRATAEEWATVAAGAGIECQRCPCKGYRILNSKSSEGENTNAS